MNNIKRSLLVIGVICYVSTTLVWSQSMWPTFQYDNQRTGRCPYIGPDTSDTLWTYTAGDNIFWSSPAIAEDGTIYFGCMDGYLYAMNPDGSLKWTYATYGDVLSSPAIGEDGTIYFGSSDNTFYAIADSVTYGSLRWTFTGSSHGFDSPILIGIDGTSYAVAGDLYAIDTGGNLKWSYSTGIGGDEASVATSLDGSCLYTQRATANDYFLACVDTSGNVDWERDIGGAPWDFSNSTPAVGPDGVIYFPTGHGGPLYAINPNSTIEWTCGGLGDLRYTSPGIGADSTIYMAGGFDNDLHAIAPGGSVVWTFNTTNTVISSPIVDGNGTIYIASYDTLYAIYPDGTMKWELEIETFTTATPAMDTYGNLYVCSGRKLYAIGPGGVSGIADNASEQPARDVFLHNYPNPFNPETTIRFQLPEDELLELTIHNLQGQMVRTLVNEVVPAGMHSAIWNGRDSNGNRASSGIYFYKLKAGELLRVRKMILLK
jgi:outer membrane protein assembly factor BamB